MILGHWIHVDPQRTPQGVRELRRCIDKRQGFLGFAVSASLTPPASDPLFDPYYSLCREAGIPVLIFVGTTGLGAGLPAGGGVMLENCHPRHLDNVAARYPGLHLVAGGPGGRGRPRRSQCSSISATSGTSFMAGRRSTTRPISSTRSRGACKNRILFAADYPLFSYERLVRDWRAEGYPEEVLEQVFYKNAEAFLASLADES